MAVHDSGAYSNKHDGSQIELGFAHRTTEPQNCNRYAKDENLFSWKSYHPSDEANCRELTFARSRRTRSISCELQRSVISPGDVICVEVVIDEKGFEFNPTFNEEYGK